MNNVIISGILISMAFAGWPIIGNYSGASGVIVGTIVAISTALSVIIFSAKGLVAGGLPTVRAVVILSIAGFLNGAALYYYSLITADQNVPTSVFVATVAICMTVVAPTLYYFTKGVAPSLQQWAGYALAPVVIYLLTPK